ncbi:MAG: stage V sporulation protein AC [Oscillospiraceae bacterium]|nr:stage V sporulation protein AC [Oscillospiraceae bacterium]
MSLKTITPQQYDKMVKQASPNSKSWVDIPKAFLIGGAICCIGQGINNLYSAGGFDTKTAASWTSITLVLISALLTGFGLYEKLAKHGGAGTLVPITGFANAVVSPALEFKAEGFVLGLGAKIFIISGPVILYGTAASVIYGLIYYFFLR